MAKKNRVESEQRPNGAGSSVGSETPEDSESLWDTFELLQNQMRELLRNRSGAEGVKPQSLTGARIKEILRTRAMRAKFFKAELFADPAWDMLLDLYRAHCDEHRVSVSSICLASGVPSTTALRWLSVLEEDGLIARRPDPFDGRRSFVRLTPKAIEAVEAYFAAIGSSQPI